MDLLALYHTFFTLGAIDLSDSDMWVYTIKRIEKTPFGYTSLLGCKAGIGMSDKQHGFTLIELMVVVVIVAILAAVAIPSYQNSIQKTRRADAKEALTRIAAMQERYFFTNNRYGDSDQLGIGQNSQEGFYTIVLDNTDTTFRVRANPQGAQENDLECNLFTLNQVGQRSAQSSTNVDTTDECW